MNLMKIPTPLYERLLTDLWLALGPDRKPLVIGIDGREGTGKTSLSNWLAWQLGMPVIHLDLFLEASEVPGPIAPSHRGSRPLHQGAGQPAVHR
jgi:hypothetical protein